MPYINQFSDGSKLYGCKHCGREYLAKKAAVKCEKNCAADQAIDVDFSE